MNAMLDKFKCQLNSEIPSLLHQTNPDEYLCILLWSLWNNFPLGILPDPLLYSNMHEPALVQKMFVWTRENMDRHITSLCTWKGMWSGDRG